MQSVCNFLLFVWLDNLSQDDQFEFWFNMMDANDRCRLWNSLVFSYKPFYQVFVLSKEHKTVIAGRPKNLLRTDLLEMGRLIQKSIDKNKAPKKPKVDGVEEKRGKRVRDIYNADVFRALWT